MKRKMYCVSILIYLFVVCIVYQIMSRMIKSTLYKLKKKRYIYKVYLLQSYDIF
jgi:hypothetical protein